MIVLPKRIYLTALGNHWRVTYCKAPGALTLIEVPYRKLIIRGNRYSKRDAIKLLNKWVEAKAKKYLTALLFKLNLKIKAKYKKLIIHSLKMEWGSYSSKETLGLNYKLIFLPPKLVRHVLIHELCHTRYLNHSPEFWKEVAKYDKSWKKNTIAINDAEIHVPEWLVF